jgi:phosphate acetyltransferase
MARSVYVAVYVAGLDPSAGKSLVALGVAELLSRRAGRLAVFRPIAQAPDPLLELLRRRYGVTGDPYGVDPDTALELLAAGRADELAGLIVERYRAVADGRDAVVVVGGDLDPADGSVRRRRGLPHDPGFDARLAAEFGAALIAVVDGRAGTPAEIVERIGAGVHELGAPLLATVVNRVPAGRLDAVRAALSGLTPPAYAVAEVPELGTPSVAEVAAALGAKQVLGATQAPGDDAGLSRDVHGFVVGGATVPVFLDHLADGALVITPGDRADVIIAAYTAHAAGMVSLAGILLTLGEAPDPRAVRLVERLHTGLALLLVPQDSFAAVTAAGRVRPALSAASPRKVEAALGAFEAGAAALADAIALARPARVTPLMFEYRLVEGARAAHRHVVLPEGTEERILRAAELVLHRQVAELTLLGEPDLLRRRARELGVNLTGAHLVDPGSSPWREEFAATYADLRRHKAVALGQAYDTVADPTYFGTLMVHAGYADAMVSGAVHPTAATIRPAFEIIKTVPGVSVASSVFFMCLADRVLVYGDCAVIPDPDAIQLADIAISSADTAARFDIEPRVALLSYSTGTSGHGVDVAKVAAATELVRARRPDLAVAGPIQYDAAVDPGVAATKLPGDAVAGHATVLVFPDLNTGNNTYKAVQRSAHAVAIGPVLQGLRRPVNDLSRGATVRDIVNTIAITAIQAGTS